MKTHVFDGLDVGGPIFRWSRNRGGLNHGHVILVVYTHCFSEACQILFWIYLAAECKRHACFFESDVAEGGARASRLKLARDACTDEGRDLYAPCQS